MTRPRLHSVARIVEKTGSHDLSRVVDAARYATAGVWQVSQVDDGAPTPLGGALAEDAFGSMRRTGGLAQQANCGENG
jgi:hypothetical protein